MPRYTKAMRAADFFRNLENLGLSYTEADKLRLIEKTLSRWSELECGNSNDFASWHIERDEKTEKPFLVRIMHQDGKTYRHPIPDREKGALRRAAAIIGAHPNLWFFHQTDPRGCSLYVGRKSDIPEGAELSTFYTRGIACCIE